jgi:hypothetical protein
MKISRKNLFMIIENLLFEEENKYKSLTDEIISSKAINKGLIKAYKYITGEKYNPKFLRNMSEKEREDFLDHLVLELKKIVEEKEKIKFSDSEGKTDAYATLGTFENDGNIEFEIVLYVDNISKKDISGSKLSRFIEDKVFHEFMHVENHFANLKSKFNEDASGIMITLDKLETDFYRKRYNQLQKSTLKKFYKEELDPNTGRGIDEIRVRIALFKANNNLEEALEFSKSNNLTAIIKRYGDSDAPWLFMLDYSKDIPDLIRAMDDLAKVDIRDVQTFKT